MGALTQVRVLGGTIGLAIWDPYAPPFPFLMEITDHLLSPAQPSELQNIITSSQLLEISDSITTIETLTPEQQAAVRTTFAEGYNKQMRIMTIFSGVAVLTTLLLWERRPRRVE